MVTLSKRDIINLLEIVDPFLMIDKLEFENNGLSGVGEKTISKDEWFYKCHFLNDPVMPGMLQTEAMLQTIISIFCATNELKAKDCLINKVSSSFQTYIRSSIRSLVNQIKKSGVFLAKAVLLFSEQKISEGSFRFIIPKKFQIKKRKTSHSRH